VTRSLPDRYSQIAARSPPDRYQIAIRSLPDVSNIVEASHSERHT
jgi:hypothetical protein